LSYCLCEGEQVPAFAAAVQDLAEQVIKNACMRVAAIYDIHGNLPALDAVLDEIRRSDVDQVIVGGDVVPGPMPRETIARLLKLELPVRFIQGNGDREVVSRIRGVESTTLPEPVREVIRWVAQQLDPEHEQLLADWPTTLRIGEVLFCHATPRNDTEIFTRLTAEAKLRPIFDATGVPLVVCGHTHMPFDRTIGDVRVINAGSVGMPFGASGAYWLLLGPGAADVHLRKTNYDLSKAADLIRSTTYPQAEEFATRNILDPPSEAAILEAFSRAELLS
jgi:putative phosphoesterase